ncbi:hypothetical protein VaNZ11_009753, partial [Volvox africanus]
PAPPQPSNLPLLPYQPFAASPAVMLQPAAAHVPSAAVRAVTGPPLPPPPPPPPAPRIMPSLLPGRPAAPASKVSDDRKQLLSQIQIQNQNQNQNLNQADSKFLKHVKSNSMGAYHPARHPASQDGVTSPHQRPHQE